MHAHGDVEAPCHHHEPPGKRMSTAQSTYLRRFQSDGDLEGPSSSVLSRACSPSAADLLRCASFLYVEPPSVQAQRLAAGSARPRTSKQIAPRTTFGRRGCAATGQRP
ncbi:hypothetical protein PsYK624_083770 [Phanerochaete sordida]|uniref:Uncharacterized protein n=1 Tax=Phanerochaete sordida TaxID=48140 RepID=A0A9P3GEE5_9APHY|nr:hypothetical protein PsYK624_083770 [Phanerochaete sordida]